MNLTACQNIFLTFQAFILSVLLKETLATSSTRMGEWIYQAYQGYMLSRGQKTEGWMHVIFLKKSQYICGYECSV